MPSWLSRVVMKEVHGPARSSRYMRTACTVSVSATSVLLTACFDRIRTRTVTDSGLCQ